MITLLAATQGGSAGRRGPFVRSSVEEFVGVHGQYISTSHIDRNV